MENNVCIYALIDPRTNEIRYVGQTVDPVSRLDTHISGGRGGKAKTRWIENLYQSRHIPLMKILDWVPESHADAYEQQWIKALLEDGMSLTNSTFNPNGVRYDPKKMGRPPKLTGMVYQYMDQILETENRVASYSEVKQVLNLARSTASKLRNQWLEDRGIQDE